MFETIEEYIIHLFELPPCEEQADWIKVFLDMAVHTRKRCPKELLLATRPNEEPHILRYRLDNYEPITYGSMNKALDDLFRMFNDINYSIKVDDKVRKYINKNLFYGFTLNLFLQKIVLKRMIEDPNGFLVWMPSGLGLVDSSQKVEPKPYLLYSDNFIYRDDNIWIFLSNEKSPYKDNSDKMQFGKVYWLFTKEQIVKVFQTGSNEQEDWESVIFYQHKLNDFPVIVLGGDMNADGFYESYFAPYLAFGNQAIRQFSDWQAIMVTSSFPYIEDFVTECEMNAQVDRYPAGLSKDDEKYSTTVMLKPFSKGPHGVTLRPIPSDNDKLNFSGVLDVNTPSRRFISPDIEIAKYAGDSWETLIGKAENALNLNLTQPNQSGVAKEFDNESKYSMINKIGNNYFDNIYLKSLQLISGYLKNSESDTTVSIGKPTTFTIKTESMLIDQIAKLKEKNAPSMFLSEATVDLARKMFSGDDLSKKIFTIISVYDPLFIYTIGEKESMLMSNGITKEQYMTSVYIYSILHQMVDESSEETFMTKDNKALYEEVLARVVLLLPKTTPLTNPDGTVQ